MPVDGEPGIGRSRDNEHAFRSFFAFIVFCHLGFAAAQGVPPTTSASELYRKRRVSKPGRSNTVSHDAGLSRKRCRRQALTSSWVPATRDKDCCNPLGLRGLFEDSSRRRKAEGTDTVALVYLSGYRYKLERGRRRELFRTPSMRRPPRTRSAADAIRISDYARTACALKRKQYVIVLDTRVPIPLLHRGGGADLPAAWPRGAGKRDTDRLQRGARNRAPEGDRELRDPTARRFGRNVREGGMPVGPTCS